ncbi:LacI family DNA-binding transcriptional regulator [Pontiellaceae bacterium B1224]|nr:LacI family DNA-binding transcriptional regulator [Pontiellaceae bacterium B1224]
MSEHSVGKSSSADGDQQRVTLRDIARAIGVSHVTVSLALRGSQQISEPTRLKVQKKAEEMGYAPDPMLAALSHYRLKKKDMVTRTTLAWINPLQDPAQLRKHREFDLYWKGAADAARKLGYQIEEFCVKDLSLQRMESVFKARNIKGILLASVLSKVFHDGTVDWDHFSWQDFVTVRFGRKATHPQSHFVTSAQASNTIMAFSRITDKGYSHIGYVGEYTEARVFCAGFLFAQLGVPEELRVPPLMFYQEELPQVENENVLNKWIEKHRPDAILTDRPYVQLMLKKLGYRVPEDIGLATTSIHDTGINTGIDQKPEEIGRAAVRLLSAEINHNHFGIPSTRNEMLIEGTWVDGSMLPDRNG